MKKLLPTLVLGSSMLLGLVGCHGGGGGVVYQDPYYTGWYDVYGNECGSLKAGCNYWSDGWKIVDYEDPYYNGNYVWDYFYDYYYNQYVWSSPSGILYDDWGNALNNANSGNFTRDLFAQVNKEEQKTIERAGKVFSAKYSLSQDVGIKVAKAFNDWAKLGFTRGKKGRTQADIADFTKRLYGVDFNKVSSALQSAATGDQTELNDTLAEAASNWNTTPETMRQIVTSFHSRQIEAAGLKLE